MIGYIEILLSAVISLSRIIIINNGLTQETADILNKMIKNLEELQPKVRGTSNNLTKLGDELKENAKKI